MIPAFNTEGAKCLRHRHHHHHHDSHERFFFLRASVLHYNVWCMMVMMTQLWMTRNDSYSAGVAAASPTARAAFLSTKRSRRLHTPQYFDPEDGNNVDQQQPQQQQQQQHTDEGALLDTKESCSWSILPEALSPEQGQDLVQTLLLPDQDYGSRIQAGRDAQGLQASTVVTANDPSMTRTYGEFPLTSLDQVLDLAQTYATTTTTTTTAQEIKNVATPFQFVDVGSGCGRLVLYMALTRPEFASIHGIEISSLLHQQAVQACQRAATMPTLYLTPISTNYNNDATTTTTATTSSSHPPHRQLCLSCESAQSSSFLTSLTKDTILFCYSTTWKTVGFSTELGAMILGSEWSQLFAQVCSPGSIVITTDRALDPHYGWKLLDRIDVNNPEVMGSTAYISMLSK